MLSRVAESLYWLGRYVERAENVARAVDVNLQLQLDLPGEERPWDPVVQTGGNADLFFRKYAHATAENVMNFLAFDRENPSSIVSCVAAVRENARTVRENIPTELWMVINRFHLHLSDPEVQAKMLESPHGFFESVKEFSQLVVGIMHATMNHDEAWQFSRIGKFIERADQTSRILDVKYYILLPDVSMVGMQLDNVQWSSLLKSISAFQMFRRAYGEVTPRNVAEFLLLSQDFPRSLRHCLAQTMDALRNVALPERADAESLRICGRAHAMLEFTTIDEIQAKGLHQSIDAFQSGLNDLSLAIRADFFR